MALRRVFEPVFVFQSIKSAMGLDHRIIFCRFVKLYGYRYMEAAQLGFSGDISETRKKPWACELQHPGLKGGPVMI